MNDEITSAKALVNSYYILCQRKRQESERLNNDISRLKTVIIRFKNNNEEYLKLKKTVEEEIRNVLTDGKVLLQFALASVMILKYQDLYYDHLTAKTNSFLIVAVRI